MASGKDVPSGAGIFYFSMVDLSDNGLSKTWKKLRMLPMRMILRNLTRCVEKLSFDSESNAAAMAKKR